MALKLVLTSQVNDLDAYKSVAADMCKVAETEPGTLTYIWQVSSDGKQARNVDVYASPEAFLEHFGAAQDNGHLGRFVEAVTIQSVQAVGDPGAAKDVLDGFGAVYFEEFASIPKA